MKVFCLHLQFIKAMFLVYLPKNSFYPLWYLPFLRSLYPLKKRKNMGEAMKIKADLRPLDRGQIDDIILL